MSVVTGVTLIYRPSFTDPEQKIQEWLKKRDFMPLAHLSRYYGGTKHPQHRTLGAGYNYFSCEEDFIKFIMNIEWDNPENTILIMQPEEGPTEVYTPLDSRCYY